MPKDTSLPLQDKWSEWILDRRYSGNAFIRDMTLQHLFPIADKLLDNAAVRKGDILLDIGTGDGLIGFRAIERVGPEGKVVFSDISPALVEHCHQFSINSGLLENSSFITTGAEDLSLIESESIDVITLRSVLIYVSDKQRSFSEFHRVLKHQGRVAIFEPIGRFDHISRKRLSLLGYDLSPLGPIGEKVISAMRSSSLEDKLSNDPMVNFDERDLVAYAEAAGFKDISLEYNATITPPRPGMVDWESFYNYAPNPNACTLKEAVEQSLSPDESQRFMDFMIPLVGEYIPGSRDAIAFLKCVKA